MSHQGKDLPISTNENDQGLAITLEELQQLWEQCITRDDDRREGEFTKDEAANLWNMAEDTIYDRLEKMVRFGALTKRQGRRSGRRATYYKACNL